MRVPLQPSTMDNRRVARTAKGQDEIANRRKSLKGKLRTVLFLIDPGKPVDAILEQVALIGAPADSLAQLVTEGYIEEISGQGADSFASGAFPDAANASAGGAMPAPAL